MLGCVAPDLKCGLSLYYYSQKVKCKENFDEAPGFYKADPDDQPG